MSQYKLKRIDKSAENGVAAEDGSRQTQVNATELKATDSSIIQTNSPIQNEVFSIRFCVDNHQIEMLDVFVASPPWRQAQNSDQKGIAGCIGRIEE